MINRFFSGLALAGILFSCNSKKDEGTNKFSDPVILKIADLKDRRQTDSLVPYLSNENGVYRKEAALAFASVQDSSIIDRLGKLLLLDSDTAVQRAAAFAIGQTRCLHSERILLGALAKESNYHIVQEFLEAYGKTTSHWQLVQPTLLTDTAKTAGFAWSLYRAGLNGKTDTTVNAAAAMLLEVKYNELTRLGSAHFFARGAKNFDAHIAALIKSAKEDPSDEVRMAAASALRKIKKPESRDALFSIVSQAKNPLVRINAVRALQSFPYAETKPVLLKALREKNVNVGIAAAETIRSSATADDWVEISNLTNSISNWRVQAIIYEAALALSDNKALAEEIKTLYGQTKNPYQKAALLTALQSSIASLSFIEQQLMEADTPVIRSTAAAALVALNYHKNFNPRMKTEFAVIYQKAMASGDPAVIGTIAGALGDSTLGYKAVVKDYTFIEEARKKLSLPKDNEAMQPLEKALAYFEGKKSADVKNEFNHPIDWALVKTIARDQEAVIKTTKGKITIRLFVEDAPGSVANFIKLAKSGYFDGRPIHRVVPNFVVQAGCNRGDGWGSEDYSIRSEFAPRKYKTGSIGMASAGKDTEGTQWFITHSPTPHLDGRYTIFAEVVKGMEAVDQLEIGDQILGVEVLNTSAH
jgi:cyclophilin family peptidyl-prolyl cis-trans isomerase/HEAT repeat protein